ncbi:hypothetical protein DGo_PA0029 (plasmid) [Deinococcus gobiensis I-0]|uniref:Uncharacterized protein n=1 Tax=Deinococcus gobiensis (strain DSM 21396 / JCM 16679 / CGMCC 1.7299 / I-0) TaxID=745776 RepID=H8H0P6_DEIGI|nr:hypothetical protein DGo_PA0029 [Deinococcus gobiensis I-0]
MGGRKVSHGKKRLRKAGERSRREEQAGRPLPPLSRNTSRLSRNIWTICRFRS